MFRLLCVALIAYFSINFTLSNPDAAKRLKLEAEHAAKAAANATVKGANKLQEIMKDSK